MSGVIKDLKYLNNGQWVNIKEKLFSIVQFNDTKVVAFISENDLDKLEGNTSGYFVPKNNEFDEAEVVLVSQNNTSTEELPYLSLVSLLVDQLHHVKLRRWKSYLSTRRSFIPA